MDAYWIIAIAASVVFVVQMALTLAGLGDADADADFDGVDALQLFSLRNVVNFMLGLGWGGVCFHNVWAAVGGGCLFVALFVWMARAVMRLQRNGNFDIGQCRGQVCTVYLRIPAARSGTGKVQLSWHGSPREIAAMTDGDQIATGARVRVADIVDNETLLVKPI